MSLKPGNGESLAELHKVQIEFNQSKAGPCDPAQKRNHPSRCSVKPSGAEDLTSLKKAGRDISPFRRNGTAVLRSANKRLNPVELCEKLTRNIPPLTPRGRVEHWTARPVGQPTCQPTPSADILMIAL